MTAPRESARPAPDHRSRPRRRGDALRGPVLAAVLVELDRAGYRRLTMEAVARRAGASKASLYRHWTDKPRLVLEAIRTVAPDADAVPGTGTLRGDLIALLEAFAAMLEGPVGEALRGLVAEGLQENRALAELRAGAVGRSVEVTREVVERAVERGEIDGHGITDRQLEAGHALLRMHFLQQGAPVAREDVRRIVDEVMLPLIRG